MNRRKFMCLDCGTDTGRMFEHYFVNTDLWLSAVGTTVGMLCVGHLEQRIGRRLQPDDFPPIIVNDPRVVRMSARLLSRVTGQPEPHEMIFA